MFPVHREMIIIHTATQRPPDRKPRIVIVIVVRIHENIRSRARSEGSTAWWVNLDSFLAITVIDTAWNGTSPHNTKNERRDKKNWGRKSHTVKISGYGNVVVCVSKSQAATGGIQ